MTSDTAFAASSLLQTRFSTLLKTNYSATPEDVEEIRALVAAPKAEQAQIDEELRVLGARMDELMARREDVEKFVSSHLALASPIRGISEDVLAEIFLHCLPTDRIPSRSVAEAPIVLIMVCRKWKEIALRTPRLWAALHIYFPTIHRHLEAKSKPIFKRRREGVEKWFRRSGDLPITFSLVVHHYEMDFELYYKPIVKTLSLFAHRWQNVNFKVPTNMLRLLAKAINPENVPRLQKLKIDYGLESYSFNAQDFFGMGGPMQMHPQNNGELPFSEVLAKAPGLRSLALYNYKQNVCAMHVAWENLTHLELMTGTPTSQQSPEALLPVLKKAALSLRSCVLTVCVRQTFRERDRNEEGTLGGREPVVLPELRTLSVNARLWPGPWWPPHPPHNGTRRGENPEMAAFFSTILVPTLTSFSYVMDQSHTPEASTSQSTLPFIQMLIKSDCQLKKLHISGSPSAASLIECLRAMPVLSSFCIQEQPDPPPPEVPPGPPGGIQVFSTSSEDFPAYCAFQDSVAELLIPSPENPQPLCPHLETLNIYNNYAANEELIKKLREEEGMKVSMIYPPPYRVSDSPWAGQTSPGSHQELGGSMGAHGSGIHDFMGPMGIAVPMNGNTFMTQFVTGFGGGAGGGFGGGGGGAGPGPGAGVAAAGGVQGP
uniref:F-box domain-containing protein n=1 Tax=Moniliophthora roreri TaxID=221103 RepID=A0A0W0G8T9_MONRR